MIVTSNILVDDLINIRPYPSLIGHHQLLVGHYIHDIVCVVQQYPCQLHKIYICKCPCKGRWLTCTYLLLTAYTGTAVEVQLPQTTVQSCESSKLLM